MARKDKHTRRSKLKANEHGSKPRNRKSSNSISLMPRHIMEKELERQATEENEIREQTMKRFMGK